MQRLLILALLATASAAHAEQVGEVGARQSSCRLVYAANGCLRPAFVWSATTESRSGLRVTAPMGVQSRAGPQIGVGIGGGSGGGYRGCGFSFGGIGISLPIGGATTAQGLGATTSLADAASGSLVWSGGASTPASGDLRAQVGELARVTVEALRKAGLI